jgi:urocanate hydratase
MEDNLRWIEQAEANRLVVGSQARILYSDSEGRCRLAMAFNEAIASGRISRPIVLSRDHHDVSGTDAPFRETSNVTDGSMFTADMSVQNAIGLGFRGATYLALHNGGGTGWGNAVNGGFGLVLDGSPEAARRAKNLLFWDVNNGVARRSFARNKYAEFAIRRAMRAEPKLKVTLPNHVEQQHLDEALRSAFK